MEFDDLTGVELGGALLPSQLPSLLPSQVPSRVASRAPSPPPLRPRCDTPLQPLPCAAELAADAAAAQLDGLINVHLEFERARMHQQAQLAQLQSNQLAQLQLQVHFQAQLPVVVARELEPVVVARELPMPPPSLPSPPMPPPPPMPPGPRRRGGPTRAPPPQHPPQLPRGRGRPRLTPDQKKVRLQQKAEDVKNRRATHRATLTEEEIQAERDTVAEKKRKRLLWKRQREGRTVRVYRKRGQSVAATINVL